MQSDKLFGIRDHLVREVELSREHHNEVDSIHSIFTWDHNAGGYEVKLTASGEQRVCEGRRRYMVNETSPLEPKRALLLRSGDCIDRYNRRGDLDYTLLLHASPSRYAVYRTLVDGNRKKVLLAFDTFSRNNLVVLKLREGETDERFARAALNLGRIISVYIPQLRDVGTLHFRGCDYHYQCFEYFAGKPLDQWLQNDAFDLKPAMVIFHQVLEALCRLHQSGFVHRNINLQHILCDDDDHVHLVGLSVIRSNQDQSAQDVTLSGENEETELDYTITEPEEIVGSVSFSPLRLNDDPRGKDLYTTAVLFLYSMLAPSLRRDFVEHSVEGTVTEKWSLYCPNDLADNVSIPLRRLLSFEDHFEAKTLSAAFSEALGYAPHKITCNDQYPTSLSNTVNIPGLELAIWSEPYEEVNGDFYDYIDMGHSRYGLLLGDTVGHGLKACMYRHLIHPIPHLFAGQLSPMRLLEKMDSQLYKMRQVDRIAFATAFYGILCLEPQNPYLLFANAGHPLPVLKRGDEIVPLQIKNTRFIGTKLGMGGDRFHSVENFTALQPQDLLFFYTDGIIEAGNQERRTYEQRFFSNISSCAISSPAQIVADFQRDFREFCRDLTVDDDITLIVMRIL